MTLFPYRQLILVDCDGGRGAIFDEKSLLSNLPSNCELYLFWNNNDKVINDKLNDLRKLPHIHCYPSIKTNKKNATDGKLIYFLGKLVDEFSSVLLITGGDEIFEEVVSTVNQDYGYGKIELKKLGSPSSASFNEILSHLEQQNNKYASSNVADKYHLKSWPSVAIRDSDLFFNIEEIKTKMVLNSNVQQLGQPLPSITQTTISIKDNRCPICGANFFSIFNANQHVICKHYMVTSRMTSNQLSAQKNVVESQIKCPMCSEIFTKMERVQQHIASKHATLDLSKTVLSKKSLIAEKNINCLRCSRKFASTEDMHRHTIAKHDISLVTCTCSSTAMATQKFHAHKSRNKKYKCMLNNKGFITCPNVEATKIRIVLLSGNQMTAVTNGETNLCPIDSCRHLKYFKTNGLVAHVNAKHKQVQICVLCCGPTSMMYSLEEYKEHLNTKHLIASVL
ncbi:unnamed protein product [Rotaria socialis]|uniref:C2H2-type domain-containing protein n=1 Tax=Rotaria socialis TaxID=392032 RepID=A0A820PPW1_9BILA|nr:unnamed protein product [Rotaria socialis]CAF4408295.1 unnamed protein product [Rotaria socialis]